MNVNQNIKLARLATKIYKKVQNPCIAVYITTKNSNPSFYKLFHKIIPVTVSDSQFVGADINVVHIEGINFFQIDDIRFVGTQEHIRRKPFLHRFQCGIRDDFPFIGLNDNVILQSVDLTG